MDGNVADTIPARPELADGTVRKVMLIICLGFQVRDSEGRDRVG